ncbi:MAG: 2-amino-4-hydroxy-6-hydroxymethyldihydropteridine diphosphokinase [Muribaculaceae bacterium]|nr:2-amino-4-hydroxy-6-hydroxymethyldihydropteridine diphosphokinase [Muribaculaceae bacterium]
MPLIFVNIGTNLGDRRRNLSRAAAEIGRRFGYFELSHVMESEPWGYESNNKFMNVAMVFRSEEDPLDILHALQEIERRLGNQLAEENMAHFIPVVKKEEAGEGSADFVDRHRNADGSYADRFLDIDIMTIEGVEMQTDELTLPHPHLRERPFFMEPLQELLDQIPT